MKKELEKIFQEQVTLKEPKNREKQEKRKIFKIS